MPPKKKPPEIEPKSALGGPFWLRPIDDLDAHKRMVEERKKEVLQRLYGRRRLSGPFITSNEAQEIGEALYGDGETE